MASLRLVLLMVVSDAIMACPPAFAKVSFAASELEGQGSEVVFCDLDGDRLKDVVLIEGLNLCIFYQEKQGFPRKPHQRYRLEDRPCVVWPARLGTGAEGLLVMTRDGVAELCFTNRNSPPLRQQIIRQETIIPQALDEPQAMHFPLTADTGGEWPLLLVPVADGLQVWQHREGWRQTQFLEHAVEAHIRPSVTNAGYTQSFGLDLSLGDVNGDGREDLMVMCQVPGGMQTHALYLQEASSPFAAQAALIYTNTPEWRTALCWVDLNRDGKLDLIKSTFLDEPFFIPGLRSGKVFVRTFVADAKGRIPAEPQRVFRKNDWSLALPVVDVDGDGFTDLVLGYIAAETKEALRKIITSEEVEFSAKFYFSRSGTGFPETPDCQREVAIRFHRDFSFNLDRRLYYERFINLNGDFNGDGKKDLLVRDRSHEISILFFISREKGFSREADLRLSCPEPIDWWEVRDVNGDGTSDLVVKLEKRNMFRIYVSQSK